MKERQEQETRPLPKFKENSKTSKRSALGTLLFRGAGLMGGIALTMACNSGQQQTQNSGYELVRAGDQLEDKKLLEKADQQISSVEFSFDPNYAPGTAGGSLAMKICFEGDGNFRIISKEIKPNSGWLVNVVYPHQTECLTKHPVIELNIGDQETVFVGSGNAPEKTNEGMRSYVIFRSNSGLTGNFDGKSTIALSDIRLRDNSTK